MPAIYYPHPCPKCQSKVYDNRDSKRNPKAPDGKCSNKACDFVIWPPRGNGSGGYGPASTPKTGAVKLGYDSGGPIPGLDDVEDIPPIEEAYASEPAASSTSTTSATFAKLESLFKLYGVCFDQAVDVARKAHGLNPDVAAMAATLYIAANNRGITL